MQTELLNINGACVALVISDAIEINTTQDAVELIMNCRYSGADKIILYEKNITPTFFELRNGVAGDILQKFSTYDAHLAIIGDYSKFTSKSLKDFIYESNKTGRIHFANSLEDAKKNL